MCLSNRKRVHIKCGVYATGLIRAFVRTHTHTRTHTRTYPHARARTHTPRLQPNSLGYIVQKCQEEKGCYNQSYIEGHLKEQYPRLQVCLLDDSCCVGGDGCDLVGWVDGWLFVEWGGRGGYRELWAIRSTLMPRALFIYTHKTYQVYKCDVKTGKFEHYVYKPYRRDYAGPRGDGGI
jgi:hypothetical protein